MDKTASEIKTTSAKDLKIVKSSETTLNQIIFSDKKLSKHLCTELFAIQQNINRALRANKAKAKLHSRGRKEKQKQKQ